MDRLEKLKQEIVRCRDCQELFGFEPCPIVRGKKNAKIVQIGQAPSLLVQKTHLPFHDASGKRLKQQWYEISDAVFYDESLFYLSSLGHCYPGKNKRGTDQKPPACCREKWLWQELELVDNEMYILIGSLAATYFFPKQNFEELIFHDQVLNGKPAYVLPHPSPLNQRWIHKHPTFPSRMEVIRKEIHRCIGC